MGVGIKNVMMIAVSLMVVAVILPIGLGLLAGAGDTMITINGTQTALSDLVDPSVLTLLTVMIPILAVIGIAIGYISTKTGT
jgi:hypothetical protein